MIFCNPVKLEDLNYWHGKITETSRRILIVQAWSKVSFANGVNQSMLDWLRELEAQRETFKQLLKQDTRRHNRRQAWRRLFRLSAD